MTRLPLNAHDIDLSKAGLAHYFVNYDTYLGPMRDDPIRFLELGVAEGHSLRHWENWFSQAQITGLDIHPCPIEFTSGRVKTYIGEQQDTALLDKIAAERAPDGFDVIIDDASHVGQLTRISFWHLFDQHLKAGGLYVIEDWGTGYWSDYPDGRKLRPKAVDFAWHEKFLTALRDMSLVQSVYPLRKLIGWMRWHMVKRRHPSHDYGMVGFVKEVIDEVGIADATAMGLGTSDPRPSRIEWMRVSLGQVIIKKAKL